MTYDPPIYMIVGMRPCMFVRDEKGVPRYLAWDWEKKEFVRDFDFVYASVMGRKAEDEVEYNPDIRRVSKAELDGQIEAIRAGRDQLPFMP